MLSCLESWVVVSLERCPWSLFPYVCFCKEGSEYWVSGLCPSSGILNTRKHVSKTGSVSVLKWGEGDTSAVSLRCNDWDYSPGGMSQRHWAVGIVDSEFLVFLPDKCIQIVLHHSLVWPQDEAPDTNQADPCESMKRFRDRNSPRGLYDQTKAMFGKISSLDRRRNRIRVCRVPWKEQGATVDASASCNKAGCFRIHLILKEGWITLAVF
jgi:hypothetical protein